MNSKTERVELGDHLFTYPCPQKRYTWEGFSEINSFLMEKLRSTPKNCNDLHGFLSLTRFEPRTYDTPCICLWITREPKIWKSERSTLH